MLRVDTLQDLFMAAETLARFGKNHDGALTLMTNGGGAGVMAADAAALAGVPLRELGAELRTRLDAVLPPTWSRANPIDIIGDAPVATLRRDPAGAARRSGGDAVLFIHAPTAIVRSDAIARACAPLVRAAAGRVMACWLGDAAVAEARRILADAGAADYATPEEAVRAFALLSTYRRNQELLLEAPTASECAAPDPAAARRLVDGALAAGREMLDEFEAKALLQAYRIPTVETRATAPDAQAALQAAAAIGYPVALKIRSPDISHKTEVGGVMLGLPDAEALHVAAERMLARVRTLRPAARISGFTVQRFAQRPFAVELIVGSSVDPVFGPVLLFGAGGTAVEVVADRAVALPPLNRVLARELIAGPASRGCWPATATTRRRRSTRSRTP
jgi:acetyltransferase